METRGRIDKFVIPCKDHTNVHLQKLSCSLVGQWEYKKKTPWAESASELYLPSDSRLSAKLVPHG
jgi:hypothetical protein